MLPEVTIKPNEELTQKARFALGDELSGKAIAAAIKKTAAKVRTRLIDDVEKSSGLKKREVRSRIYFSSKDVKTADGNVSAIVSIGSKPYQAISFDAEDFRPGGVAVGKPNYRRWEKAFIAKGPKVGKQVFQRQGKERRKLRIITHQSASELFQQYGDIKKVERFIEEDIGPQIESQIDRFMEKAL